MTGRESGPEAGAKGVIEDMKGKAKEAAGAVAGNDRLKDEGRAQQDKAASQREVATKEAQADAARVKAGAYEAEEKANRR
jgi:uncharacterized protein YjbJ (UPF0337 family)